MAKRSLWLLLGATAVLLSSIAVKHQLAEHHAPLPEAILVLGGGNDREKAAAQLAASYPNFNVWISSGDGRTDVVYEIFETVGVSRHRVHLDYRATDTVTNFTTLVSEFQDRNIRHLYVVTSDFHMPRAKVVATLVLGHSGITFTPIASQGDKPLEAWSKVVRDGGRSLLWIMTGHTGAQIGRGLIGN